MTTPDPADVRALDALTPAQLAAVQKILDAILATAPDERPPHWSEIPDIHYNVYMDGKNYMLWDLAQMLRKVLTPAAATGDPR